ncbi:flavodoxin family protein [Helicovermis profundi]|uniref:Flavodoxin-like domain-containing protein n=1 Tax=Helicovermis profundi TaxID=3065157 RepID=A0AAU9E6A9_9FIRM|nr:hypothetical protein HLPR_05080 [Clostridia bacterium S502]
MNYKVVYFTRTGSCKRVADKISKELNCDKVELCDDKNWKGFIGFFKAGYYTSKNKNVKIELKGNIEDKDNIIVVSPLWAGSLPPATRLFLEDRKLEEIDLVLVSGGSFIKNKPNCKSISEITNKLKNEDKVVSELVSKLI